MMPSSSHTTDIVIIGAGPAGLFAAFEAGMLKMRCHIVDALDMIGGQCAALYPEKPIYDIPAWPTIDAQALIDRLAEQAAPFAPVYHLGQRVERLQAESWDGADGFTLVTSKNTQIRCRGVLIAAGSGAFGPNRPPLAGIEAYEGTSVFYHVTKREQFRGKRLVIAGGGDSAVDWALSLADIAAKIQVVHRRPRFRCAPESAARLETLAREGKLELVIPYQLHGLSGHDGQLDAVTVATLDGQIRTLEADILLPFFGLAMELGPIAQWGLSLDLHHILVDPATLATNMPGIFAIGDIATYPGKLKLILCGFSEAAMACHALHKRVHPDRELHFEYSTSKGVPA
jgi:thioredoxin reductase (NADPH)